MFRGHFCQRGGQNCPRVVKIVREGLKIVREVVKTVREVVKNVRKTIPTWRNHLLYAKVIPP